LDKLKQQLPRQYSRIIHHLRHIVTGQLKDDAWRVLRNDAHRKQFSYNRAGRMSTYFSATTAQHRARQPDDSTEHESDNPRAIAVSGLFIGALEYLGWLTLAHPSLVNLIGYPLAIAAGIVAARNGFEWRYQRNRVATRTRPYGQLRRERPDEADRFA